MYDWQLAESMAETAHLSGMEEEAFFDFALNVIWQKYWRSGAKHARRLFMRHCISAYRRNRKHNAHSFNLWKKDYIKEINSGMYKRFLAEYNKVD